MDDPNDAMLRAFLGVWTGPGDYAARTASLNHDGVVVNGVTFKVNDANIGRNDGFVDTLRGNGGLDWFWVDDNLDVTDLVAGQERTNDIP